MTLNLALVLEKYRSGVGGAENYAHWLVQQLTSQGYRVHIVAEEGGGPLPDGAHLHLLSLPHKPRTLHIIRYATETRRFLAGLKPDVSLGIGRALGVDIYQPHGGVHHANLLRALHTYPSRCQRDIQYTSKLFSPKQWAFLALERLQYRRAGIRRFIALSQRVKGDMIRHYRVLPRQISLVYNGIDHRKFDARRRFEYQEQNPFDLPPTAEETTTLVFLAHNFSLKGLSCTIKMVYHLTKRGVPLRLLVGGKGKVSPFRYLVEKWGLSDKIHFLGPVEQPQHLYALGDVLVHPTFYDPCSLVCLEALASGLPLLTTTANGVSELMGDQGGRVVTNPHDIETMAGALLNLIEPTHLARASKEAHQIGSTYTLERNTQQMLEIFHQVAEEKKG